MPMPLHGVPLALLLLRSSDAGVCAPACVTHVRARFLCAQRYNARGGRGRLQRVQHACMHVDVRGLARCRPLTSRTPHPVRGGVSGVCLSACCMCHAHLAISIARCKIQDTVVSPATANGS